MELGKNQTLTVTPTFTLTVRVIPDIKLFYSVGDSV